MSPNDFLGSSRQNYPQLKSRALLVQSPLALLASVRWRGFIFELLALLVRIRWSGLISYFGIDSSPSGGG
eukprot:scaffold11362_cov37-Cyclotella_meneghiniana.AAC.3